MCAAVRVYWMSKKEIESKQYKDEWAVNENTQCIAYTFIMIKVIFLLILKLEL